MFRQILGVVDIIVGVLLITRPEFSFIRFLGLFSLGKGVWSIFSSMIMGYFLDWMGALDVLSGISLLMLHAGSSSGIFTILGISILLKGLYSLL